MNEFAEFDDFDSYLDGLIIEAEERRDRADRGSSRRDKWSVVHSFLSMAQERIKRDRSLGITQ